MKDSKGIISTIGAVLLLIFGIFAAGSGNGTFSAIGKTLLIGLGILVAVIFAIVVLVIVLALRSSREENGNQADKDGGATLEKDEKAALTSGRRTVLDLRMLLRRVENPAIRAQGDSVCMEVEKLLKTIGEKPETYKKARRYLSYYLPTLEKILRKYREMEQNRVLPEGMADNVLRCLSDIRLATEKQHQSLYEGDILDLTVEMEVLTTVCKRDGLLTEDDIAASGE